MLLTDIKCTEYEITSEGHNWNYFGYKRLNENKELVSAYIVPAYHTQHSCAVWVSREKLEQVLNFIDAIGGYE